MDNPGSDSPGFFERLTALLPGKAPDSKADVLELLYAAYSRNLMDAEALAIIEGTLAAADTHVGDVLIPRAQMDVIDVNASLPEILAEAVATAHSRFPVIDGNRDNILGILLAKDLLRLQLEKEFILRDWLRPAVFIPESKRLNVLLKEFRASRNHMAIVVDEYGGVAGLVTIEDVLEQIVGDIEDEYDFDETQDNIRKDAAGRWRVKAQTEIEAFNAAFGTQFSPTSGCDTVGGLILRHLGRMPRRNESVVIAGMRFLIQRADSRRLYTLIAQPQTPPESQSPQQETS
ncbi:MAG: CBS domain-containing protein [Zoogloeaceae bacterium]|jgi:magnesium and cobalt transporter|nr:CBS domain-containing protein [Zoogloeaceae bacterium]